MGDSFISGEGGRWAGNGANTDRGIGAYKVFGDTHYYRGPTDQNFCHRSDVAPIHSAAIPGADAFNLACSGARTFHVLGTSFYTESPQLRQLRELTETHEVALVMISIGGNDANVGELAKFCAKKSILPGSCKASRFSHFHRTVRNQVRGAVTDVVEKVKQEAPGARIVLQSYVSPYGDTMRYDEPESLNWLDLIRTVYNAVINDWGDVLSTLRSATWSEQLSQGCPIQAKDRLWMRNEVTHHFDHLYSQIAQQQGVEFLSLQNAFAGKELCVQGLSLGEDTTDPARLEWIRRISGDEDRMNESLHPNALGQQALGRCLQLVWEAAGNDYHRCANLGAGPDAMALTHQRPPHIEPVSFEIDQVSVTKKTRATDHEGLLWEDYLELTARVTASRDSSATVAMALSLNGEDNLLLEQPVNLAAGQPDTVTVAIPVHSLTMDVPQYDVPYPAQVGLKVDAFEGYLFGSDQVEVDGPTVQITVTGP
jgi:lysophospholipase L1-like esterase